MPALATPSPRDAILSRLRKLRQMTLSNGCSEAEANTALTLLAKLMASFQGLETPFRKPLQ